MSNKDVKDFRCAVRLERPIIWMASINHSLSGHANSTKDMGRWCGLFSTPKDAYQSKTMP
jgi:hypothetical protein